MILKVKNIPLGLQSSPIKIWCKSSKGSWLTNKQTDKRTNREYNFIYIVIVLVRGLYQSDVCKSDVYKSDLCTVRRLWVRRLYYKYPKFSNFDQIVEQLDKNRQKDKQKSKTI